MPAGRPKIDIDISAVEAMAGQGLTEAQIADCIGISGETLRKRKNECLELIAAIKKGKSRGLREVANSLFKSAVEGNVTAQIFYLANRDRENWQHVSRIEHAAKGGAAFVAWLPEPIESTEEWAQKHGCGKLDEPA
jgi:hypothetical protein